MASYKKACGHEVNSEGLRRRKTGRGGTAVLSLELEI